MPQSKKAADGQKKALAAILISATLLLAFGATYLQGTYLFKPAIAAALLLALAPLAAARYHNSRKKADIASRVPAFLSDLERALKTGISHAKAVSSLSAKDYGALRPELSLMKKDISEGRSFEHALRNLADRLAGTHAHHVLHNLTHSGEFHAAGAHLRELEKIDGLRRLKYQTYSLSLYALFFIFAVVATLMGKAYPQGSLPLHLIWIQAIFTGAAAGKLAENSYRSGAKHALVLFIIGTLPYIALSAL